MVIASVRRLLLLALCCLVFPSAHAKYWIPKFKDVPVQRLIANLDARVRERPSDAWLRLNLARAHAIAYALGSEEAKITVATASEGNQLDLWRAPFSHDPLMPSRPAKETTAVRQHLDRAIQLYEGLLSSVPANEVYAPVVRLGHGWCLEQRGERAGAIADYRALVKLAVGEPAIPGRNWSDASAEAAAYLIDLLDPKRDAGEIATLREQLKQFRERPEPISPIAIPLRPDTPLADIEDRAARVPFDADGRGVGQHWSWITPAAAWLAYDPARTGHIVSGTRLFGNVSYSLFWENGYQALSALDDDGDGLLSGRELDGLVLWTDKNRNGRCEADEIQPLAQAHIAALRYRHQTLPDHPDRIVYAPQGVQYEDGTSGPSYDLILHPAP